jgi:hypothetical protein
MNFFAMFSTDLKSASSRAIFDSHIECLQKILFILAIFANFKKAQRNEKNVLFVLELH